MTKLMLVFYNTDWFVFSMNYDFVQIDLLCASQCQICVIEICVEIRVKKASQRLFVHGIQILFILNRYFWTHCFQNLWCTYFATNTHLTIHVKMTAVFQRYHYLFSKLIELVDDCHFELVCEKKKKFPGINRYEPLLNFTYSVFTVSIFQYSCAQNSNLYHLQT